MAGLFGRVFGTRGRLRRIRGPGPVGAWFGARDLRAPAKESFRAWWARTGGDEDGRR
jgi:L-lactate dehydrogenase complex protein LldF